MHILGLQARQAGRAEILTKSFEASKAVAWKLQGSGPTHQPPQEDKVTLIQFK